jgi:hypothetical protein
MLMIKKLQENLIIDFYTYFLKASLNRNFLVEMNDRRVVGSDGRRGGWDGGGAAVGKEESRRQAACMHGAKKQWLGGHGRCRERRLQWVL